jgi:hypothetical protein
MYYCLAVVTSLQPLRACGSTANILKPDSEIEIEKDRLRFLIEFEGEEFFVNLDQMNKPDMGHFLEIKART